MILESDLHNESDPVRSTRAEGSQKPGKQELGKATRYGREPFRNCFRFAWGHNSIQLRGNVSFPRESRGMIYIRDGRQKTCPPPASHKAAPLAAAGRGMPPPPWCLMLLRSNKAFFLRKGARRRTFLYEAALLLSSFTDVLVIERNIPFFYIGVV